MFRQGIPCVRLFSGCQPESACIKLLYNMIHTLSDVSQIPSLARDGMQQLGQQSLPP